MHRQKKSYLIIRFMFLFVSCCCLIWLLSQVIPLQGKYQIRCIGGCFVLFFYYMMMDYKNRCRKYVKFYDTYVRINAYHKNAILNTKDLNVLYKDIKAIRLKRIPVFGVTGIEIDAFNYGNGIRIHRFYKNFPDLCSSLYHRVTAFSVEARIEENFINYLRRKDKL